MKLYLSDLWECVLKFIFPHRKSLSFLRRGPQTVDLHLDGRTASRCSRPFFRIASWCWGKSRGRLSLQVRSKVTPCCSSRASWGSNHPWCRGHLTPSQERGGGFVWFASAQLLLFSPWVASLKTSSMMKMRQWSTSLSLAIPKSIGKECFRRSSDAI